MHSSFETPLPLLAGLLTVASACILPVIPILHGTSVEQPGRARRMFIVAGFIVMIASFAMPLGAVSSAARVAQQVLVTLTALAVYLQYDVLIYARIAALFPALKGL